MNIRLIAQSVKAEISKDRQLIEHYQRMMTEKEIAERDRQLNEIEMSEHPCYFR